MKRIQLRLSSNPGLEWCLSHILTSEDIDDFMRRFYTAVRAKFAKRQQKKMASNRFVKFTEADIKPLSEEHENLNTKKETSYDLKLLKEFLANEDTRKPLQEISATELQQFAIDKVCAYTPVDIIKRKLHRDLKK